MSRKDEEPVTIPHNALLVVGDGRRVLLLRNRGTQVEPRLEVEHAFEQHNPATREQGTDAPGRYSGSPGTTPSSAFEPTNWHQLAEDRFATEVATLLNRMALADAFRTLILVVPPKALGVLRKALSKHVVERLHAQVPKDLTTHPLPEISRILAAA